ncbi:hypothetical protein GC722_15595 [Auraticoccus sp. F435]|uniref:Pr6Pr family membrane protein n=1 Tax=Auraticoccus cholistanensis TaxID=2656650 RepID=A0A6A9UX53_9ACTN|nr:Pr6Pr family membrane protein [Auraticoccus cholistanensis]MVA77433.1 hypothetical protein [Auraticoccus cholistanensis]
MRIAVAVVRLAVVAAVAAAVAATLVVSAARGPVNPFNFFGYFTVQSNLLLAAVYLATALLALRDRPVPRWLVVARAAATTYIVVVGVVYNTLLAGLAGGVELAWANAVLHLVTPVHALLDWVLVADRGRLPWRVWGYLAVYPVVWLVVVLLRGAGDGWVPYPFLDPDRGYLTVAAYALAIAVVVMAAGAGVIALSRLAVGAAGGAGSAGREPG